MGIVETRDETQANNPLHGITLEQMVKRLVGHLGWKDLGERIAIRCFTSDPSIKSSLKFLRKTPWARKKVEALYLAAIVKQKRLGRTKRRSSSRSGSEKGSGE